MLYTFKEVQEAYSKLKTTPEECDHPVEFIKANSHIDIDTLQEIWDEHCDWRLNYYDYSY